MAEMYVKLHKWADQLENTLTEWAMQTVEEHYGVDDTDHLTQEQWDELRLWVDTKYDTSYDWVLIGFNNVLNAWENANNEYD
jgi:type II secretory pathway predicted ATPase ExeA